MRKSLSFACALFVAFPAWAEPVRLGAVRLSDHPEKDVIELPGCEASDNDPVTHLQLRVNDFAAEINDLEVKFHNGEVQDVEVRSRFEPGSESRWIDLRGSARCIAKIRVKGDSNTLGRAPGRQAQIVFWGNEGDASASAAPSPAPAAAGDDTPFLGKVRLSDKPERDVIDLAECPSSANPAVREVRLGVQDFAAQIDRVKIVFQNGAEQIVEVRKRFEPGERSQWKELWGEARCIDKIVILGDADTIGRRPGALAEVRFFGR